jgi:isopentenyldiphosphate isomerase
MRDPSSVEWLEVVDRDDCVIGRQLRSDVHRLGLRHRSTHILLFNSLGRVFLQKRSLQKDINAGLWDTSAAGHVDPGESYDQCAQRELFEELGIAVEPGQLERLFKIMATKMTGWEFIQVYRVIHDGPLSFNADEIDDGRWVQPADIDAWEDTDGDRLTATFRGIWARFQAFEEQD